MQLSHSNYIAHAAGPACKPPYDCRPAAAAPVVQYCGVAICWRCSVFSCTCSVSASLGHELKISSKSVDGGRTRLIPIVERF
eukprot:scaffold18842_cov78-Skeletonema_dohrnii-CCMP3373.AAC.2